MLLDNNTEKVIDLLNIYDDLNDVDKVRLSIHLLEDLGFTPTYDINNFIKLLKNVLLILDPESKNVITNFAKYKNLLFISAKYMELSLEEKKKFSVEMLFNIFQYDFKNEEINTIVHAIGAGVGADFDYTESNYGKVIIMTDLDGTLLTDWSLGPVVPKRNLESITEFVKEGGNFSIASGRQYRDALSFFPQHFCNAPSVQNNGAVFGRYVIAPLYMLFGYNENVHGCLRREILKCNYRVSGRLYRYHPLFTGR